MIQPRRSAVTALSASVVLALGLLPGAGAAAIVAVPATSAHLPQTAAVPATSAQLPQTAAARQGAQWLAGQLSPQGYIPRSSGPGADFSATAQSVLALSAANVDPAGAQLALTYLQNHVNDYVSLGTGDGPGQLAILILDATALGENPRSFGGSDLVTRLLATQQTSGPDTGLFGTDAEAAGFSAGNYQQGLALAALAAVGVRDTPQTTAAVGWLVGQECPSGGWTTPDNANNPCSGEPSSFEGPDTNSTALALDGLAAQGAVTSTVLGTALGYLIAGQDADAGWSYFPNTVATPGASDPDSTALVIQALVSLGESPTVAPFTKGLATPVSALLSFQLTSGSGTGAFFFPPAPAPANTIATYQAVPALAGLSFGFGPSGKSYWEVASDGGIFAFGDAGFYGSEGGKPLNQPIVGITATPDGHGYWEVATDGGIFTFGDATFYGSQGGKPLNQPIVGITATPDGHGYWEVATDGGIFAFGDATFYGSQGGKPLNQPIVGITATPDGHGYWEVATDGGIFTFGDATFYGSQGGKPLNQPIVGITATPDGHGYWEVAIDGGIFTFGDATFYGSQGGKPLNQPIVGITATPDGHGYWEVATDGGIFTFGDATFAGSQGGKPLNQPIVGLAGSPARPA